MVIKFIVYSMLKFAGRNCNKVSNILMTAKKLWHINIVLLVTHSIQQSLITMMSLCHQLYTQGLKDMSSF